MGDALGGVPRNGSPRLRCLRSVRLLQFLHGGQQFLVGPVVAAALWGNFLRRRPDVLNDAGADAFSAKHGLGAFDEARPYPVPGSAANPGGGRRSASWTYVWMET